MAHKVPDGYEGWPMIVPHDDAVEINNLYVDELLGALSVAEWHCLMWLIHLCAKAREHHVDAPLATFVGDTGTCLTINTVRKAFKGLQEWGVVSVEPLTYGVYRWRLTAYAEWNVERLEARHAVRRARSEHETRVRNDSHLPIIRRQVFRRDGFICQYCGVEGTEDDLNLDHIIPVSRGGTNDPENLTTACRSCNSSKKNKTPEEWERWRAQRMGN